MTQVTLIWHEPHEKKPQGDQTVLVCMPSDPEPVQLGYNQGGVWFDDNSFPMRHVVKWWAEVPVPPKK